MAKKRRAKKQLDPKQEKILAEELKAARHAIGLYSMEELRIMFPKPNGELRSKYSLYLAMNAGTLNYMSPNVVDRYVYLKDFIEFMEKTARDGRVF